MKNTKLPNFFIKNLPPFQDLNKLKIKVRILQEIINIFEIKNRGVYDVFILGKI